MSWDPSSAAFRGGLLSQRFLPYDDHHVTGTVNCQEKNLWLEQLGVDGLPPFNGALVKIPKEAGFTLVSSLDRRTLYLKILPILVIAKNYDFCGGRASFKL